MEELQANKLVIAGYLDSGFASEASSWVVNGVMGW
jgi:hypothetical protein